jgi:hypothetical protein
MLITKTISCPIILPCVACVSSFFLLVGAFLFDGKVCSSSAQVCLLSPLGRPKTSSDHRMYGCAFFTDQFVGKKVSLRTTSVLRRIRGLEIVYIVGLETKNNENIKMVIKKFETYSGGDQ